MELTLFAFVYEGGTYEVIRVMHEDFEAKNSIYIMDHDSEGRCYCKWQLASRLT